MPAKAFEHDVALDVCEPALRLDAVGFQFGYLALTFFQEGDLFGIADAGRNFDASSHESAVFQFKLFFHVCL